MTRSISIRDIARAAGVSHTTVSRALRDSSLISPTVREHIHELAHEMGYTPNAVAQSLKNQKTNTVGLVVTSIADPFVGRVVRGIDEVALDAHLNVYLSVSNNDPDRELRVIESFQRRRVDGLIVAASRISDEYSDRLAKIRVPTVLINHQADGLLSQLHSVSIDDYSGALKAVEYLVSKGHRSIGYLGSGLRPRSNRLRLEAYKAALQDSGTEPCPDWILVAQKESRYHTEADISYGRETLPALSAAGVSAVFCYNDLIAIGALLGCQEQGIAVPSQMSIVGFDDIEMGQYVSPPLTTIHQPKLRLGQIAMEMLLDLMAGRTVQDHILQTDLVVRESVSTPVQIPS